MTDASLIVVSEFDGYAVLRLNRPEKHNAINTAMRIEFMEALEKLRDRFAVIIITGTDNAFCSGLDLKEEKALQSEDHDAEPATSW